MLAGDFNLPDYIKTSTAYGYEDNNLFLDILQMILHLRKEPTRNACILYLVLSSQPQVIYDVFVIPGISDHETVKFQVKRLPGNLYRKV